MSASIKPGEGNKRWWCIAVSSLLGVAILVRLVLLVAYHPVTYSDSANYRRSEEQIMTGWQNYDASRTPGYPVFLALVGSDQQVWLAQMALGVLNTLIVFYLAWEISSKLEARRRILFSIVAGLAHTLNLGQLFFEANLLTETLATFWLLLAMAGWVYGLNHPRRRGIGLALGTGLAACLAVITRPLFVFMPVWLLIFVIFTWLPDEASRGSDPHGDARRARWQKKGLGLLKSTVTWSLALIIPAVLVLGGWVGFLRLRYGIWGLSVMTGYHLIQNTGTFFEYVPDEYAPLRDTYLRYRDAQITEHGTQTNAIWDAIPDMQAASGLGFIGLSQLLTKLSFQLIVAHPDLYLRNVLSGWWLFWRVPVYWSAEAFKWVGVRAILTALILFERALLVGGNLLFLAVTLLAIAWKAARQFLQTSIIFWFLAGTVWFTSILQTFLDHGDNARFLVPLQSVVVICLLWVIQSALESIPSRRARPRSAGSGR